MLYKSRNKIWNKPSWFLLRIFQYTCETCKPIIQKPLLSKSTKIWWIKWYMVQNPNKIKMKGCDVYATNTMSFKDIYKLRHLCFVVLLFSFPGGSRLEKWWRRSTSAPGGNQLRIRWKVTNLTQNALRKALKKGDFTEKNPFLLP